MAEYTVEQISEENIIARRSAIEEDNIYGFSPNIGSIILFDIPTRTASSFIEAEGLVSISNGGRNTVYINGDAIFYEVEVSDDEYKYFVFNGESNIEIPQFPNELYSTGGLSYDSVRLNDNYLTWFDGPQLSIFNTIDSSYREVIVPSYPEDRPFFIDFIDSTYIDANNELEISIFWEFLLEGSDGEEIFYFNGDETTTILSALTTSGLTSLEAADNNNAVITRFDSETNLDELFFFNGIDTESIQSVNFDEAFLGDEFVISQGNVAWTSINKSNGSEGNNNNSLYIYDGTETQQIYESENSINNLLIVNERIVWEENIGGTEPTNSLFLYDGNEVIQLYSGENIVNYELSDRYVAWIDSDNLDGRDRERLFAYDGEETTELASKDSLFDPYLGEFEILDNGIAWVANNSADVFDNDDERFEVFLATTNGENITPDNNSDNADSPQNEDVVTVPNGVYRFFNQDTGVHFYTGNEGERDAVLDLPNFNYEGASYVGIDPLTGNPEPAPVYRFLNQDTGVHLYTISEVERDVTQELNNFSFEGEAFFAYPTEIDGSIPIYRFFNTISGAHFYTPSVAERDNVEANLPDFQSEGIAYYALPIAE